MGVDKIEPGEAVRIGDRNSVEKDHDLANGVARLESRPANNDARVVALALGLDERSRGACDGLSDVGHRCLLDDIPSDDGHGRRDLGGRPRCPCGGHGDGFFELGRQRDVVRDVARSFDVDRRRVGLESGGFDSECVLTRIQPFEGVSAFALADGSLGVLRAGTVQPEIDAGQAALSLSGAAEHLADDGSRIGGVRVNTDGQRRKNQECKNTDRVSGASPFSSGVAKESHLEYLPLWASLPLSIGRPSVVGGGGAHRLSRSFSHTGVHSIVGGGSTLEPEPRARARSQPQLGRETGDVDGGRRPISGCREDYGRVLGGCSCSKASRQARGMPGTGGDC